MAVAGTTDLTGVVSEQVPAPRPQDELANLTPSRLDVSTRAGRFIIPPLGIQRFESGVLDPNKLAPAIAAGAIAVREVRSPFKRQTAWAAVLWLFVGLAAVVVAIAYLARSDPAMRALAVAVVVLAAIALVARLSALESVRNTLGGLPWRMREVAIFALMSLIVVALPGAILFFGSDVPALIDQTQSSKDSAAHEATLALIGIGVQWLSIVGTSALPILLYFLFDRERLLTLRQKFTRHVFRLDPSVHTLPDIDAKYGQWLDEAYGRRSSEDRFVPGTRWPILIATSVITLGWAVALLDSKPGTVIQHGNLTALIEPTPAAPTFAFLGAYFFTLNHVLRGYVRGDLRPKTYAQVATRIVGVVVLAFVVERLFTGVVGDGTSAALLALAFLTGIVPETALIRFQELGRGFFRSRDSQKGYDVHVRTYESEPLTLLQGIDIYDRARLLDEGVSNVEALAHHDLVELLLKTRISASRLVDWVDQAILFIHCAGHASALEKLRTHGIRTATELRAAHRCAGQRKELDAFMRIVETPDGTPPFIQVVLDSLEREDWLAPLEHWHAQTAPRTLRIPEAYAEAPEGAPA